MDKKLNINSDEEFSGNKLGTEENQNEYFFQAP